MQMLNPALNYTLLPTVTIPQNLAFLQSSVETRKTVLEKFQNKNIKSIPSNNLHLQPPEENFLISETGDTIFHFSPETWSDIYNFLNLEQNKNKSNAFNNYDLHSTDINTQINNACVKFFEYIKRNPDKHIISNLKLDPSKTGFTISRQIHNMIVSESVKGINFSYNLYSNQISIKYNSCLQTLGKTMFLLFLQTHLPNIYKISFLRNNTNLNNFSTFIDLSQAILKEDDEGFQKLLKRAYDQPNLSKPLKELVKLYLTVFHLENAIKENIDTVEINTLLRYKYTENQMYQMFLEKRTKLQIELAKLASPLILWLEQQGILTISLIKIEKHKTNVIIFNEEVVFSCVQSESERCAFLHENNFKQESLDPFSTMSSVNFTFNNSFIHSHLDFETIIRQNDDETLSQTTIKIGVDTQILNFLL